MPRTVVNDMAVPPAELLELASILDGIGPGEGPAILNAADRKIVSCALRLASRQEVSVTELADALQVMVMAWEAKTTADARQSIGLSADIAFPAMPRAIKSYADARAVLQKVRP